MRVIFSGIVTAALPSWVMRWHEAKNVTVARFGREKPRRTLSLTLSVDFILSGWWVIEGRELEGLRSSTCRMIRTSWRRDQTHVERSLEDHSKGG